MLRLAGSKYLLTHTPNRSVVVLCNSHNNKHQPSPITTPHQHLHSKSVSRFATVVVQSSSDPLAAHCQLPPFHSSPSVTKTWSVSSSRNTSAHWGIIIIIKLLIIIIVVARNGRNISLLRRNDAYCVVFARKKNKRNTSIQLYIHNSQLGGELQA